MAPVTQTGLQQCLPLVAIGKVREVYELDPTHLLFVATDRISGNVVCFAIDWPTSDLHTAYDVIMANVGLS